MICVVTLYGLYDLSARSPYSGLAFSHILSHGTGKVRIKDTEEPAGGSVSTVQKSEPAKISSMKFISLSNGRLKADDGPLLSPVHCK